MSCLFDLSYPGVLLSYVVAIYSFIYGIFRKQNHLQMLHNSPSTNSVLACSFRGLMEQKRSFESEGWGLYSPLPCFPVASNPSNILWETKWQFSLKAGKGEGWLGPGSSESYLPAAQIASVPFNLLLLMVTPTKFYFCIKCYHFIFLSFVNICGDSEWPCPLASACIFNKSTSTDVRVRLHMAAWLVAS